MMTKKSNPFNSKSSKLLMMSTMAVIPMATSFVTDEVQAATVSRTIEDIAVDSNGKMYVADSLNDKVLITDSNGTIENSIDVMDPKSISVTDTEIYVGVGNSYKIYNKATLSLSKTFGGTGTIEDLAIYNNSVVYRSSDYYKTGMNNAYVYEDTLATNTQVSKMNLISSSDPKIVDYYTMLAVANNKVWVVEDSNYTDTVKGNVVVNVNSTTEKITTQNGGIIALAGESARSKLYMLHADSVEVYDFTTSSSTSFTINITPKNIAVQGSNLYITATDNKVHLYNATTGAYGKEVTPTDNVVVTSISVQGQGGAATITTDGGTLQMNASALPTNATNSAVTWSVDDTSIATIDATSGLLTAKGNGTVTVTATAQDGSGVKGTANITVSNQVDVTVSVGTVSGNPGDTIEVPVSIDTPASNIYHYTVGLDYDTSKLEFVEAVNNRNSIDGNFSVQDKSSVGGNLEIADDKASGGISTSGALFVAKFKIIQGTTTGDVGITINSNNSIFKDGFQGVLISNLTAGKVTVNEVDPTASPTLSGTAKVGETLTASSGYADGNGDTESGTTYAFYSYDSDGTSNETEVQAASTTNTYTIQAEDAGKVIKVKVIPKNANGTGSEAVSEATAVVTTETADITIGTVSAMQGQEVDVPVTISNITSDIASYGLKLDFDKDALEVVSITQSGTDGLFMPNFDNAVGELGVAWVDITGGNAPIQSDQTLFTIKFKVKATATVGDKPLAVSTTRTASSDFTDSSNNDVAENVTVGKITVSEDSVPPEVNGVTDNGVYNDDVIPTFNEGTGRISYNSGTPEIFNSGTTLIEDGNYHLEVTDDAGNKTTLSFEIDKTFPIITLEPTFNSTKSNVDIGVEIVETGSGIAHKKWAKGSHDFSYFTNSGTELNDNTFKVSENGTFTVFVEDKAGNRTTETININDIDSDAPIITINKTNTWTQEDVTVFTSFSDSVNDVVTKRWASGEKEVSFFSDTFTTSDTITVTTSDSVTVTTSDTVVIRGGGEDIVNDRFIVSSNGTYTVYARDAAGNEAIEQFSISIIDRTLPKIRLESLNEGITNQVEIEVEAIDQDSGIAVKKWMKNPSTTDELKEHGTEFTGNSFVVTENGLYTVYVKDAAGNEATESITISNIDSTLPAIDSSYISNETPSKLTVELTKNVTFSDSEGFTVRVNNEVYTITNLSGNRTSTLVFTLDKAVTYGQNVTLNYDGNGTIKDSAGNKLLAFNDYNVENKIEPPKPYEVKGTLDTENGIKAQVKISLLPNAQSTESSKYVVFQLMKGNTPIEVISIEKVLKNSEVVEANFKQSGTGYSVNVFVLSADVEGELNVGESLAEKLTLRDVE